MKTNLHFSKEFGAFLLTGLFSFVAQAQTAASSTVTVRGYFDTYYQLSPQAHQATPAPANGPYVIEGRYFDRHSQQLTLNMAELSLQKEQDGLKFRADLAFGEMVDQLSGGGSQSVAGANQVNTAANEPTRNLTQAFVSYQATDRLSLTVGKFYTPIGFEVTKAKDNWQYSRSFLFNYAIPFWHEGAYASFAAVPEKLNLSLYVVNAWDGRISQEANKSASSIVGLNWTASENLAVNYYLFSGVETKASDLRQVHELNALYTFNDRFALGLDTVIGSQKLATGTARYSAWALFVKGQIYEGGSLSGRYEMFDDSDEGVAISGGLAAAGIKQKMSSATLTYAHDLSREAQLRLELRQDQSDVDTYFKDHDGGPVQHQETASTAFLYAF